LLSTYDKSGIVEFARTLSVDFGVELIATGGTARLLKQHRLPVTLVEQITGFPEMLDGRVKTLHPKIHAGILADRDNPEHLRQLEAADVVPIDLVVVDLYPFEEAVAQPGCSPATAIEMIDIGGPCMLRAAAKNHRHVLVASDAHGRELCLAYLRGEVPGDELTLRQELAALAFNRTEEYDAAVCTYLTEAALGRQPAAPGESEEAPFLTEKGQGLIQVLEESQPLRYGENPHQQAAYLALCGAELVGVAPASQVAGDEVSFNNLADADAALRLATELACAGRGLLGEEEGPPPSVCVFIKHGNACGAGVADDPVEAYRRAYLGDPNAAMGGVLACNFAVDAQFAAAVMDSYDRWGKAAGAGGFFVEVWVAPAFDDHALGHVRDAKKWGRKARLLAVGDLDTESESAELDCRQLTGGMLVQTPDLVGLNEDEWKLVTDRPPTARELADLRLAWLICKHTRSNAITLCRDGMLIGNGAGQMSRVMSCRIATWLAQENGHAERLGGAAAASDAFFPFRDGPDLLLAAGVTAFIQPGGSKRDADTVASCKERGAAMIFTGTRHFRH